MKRWCGRNFVVSTGILKLVTLGNLEMAPDMVGAPNVPLRVDTSNRDFEKLPRKLQNRFVSKSRSQRRISLVYPWKGHVSVHSIEIHPSRGKHSFVKQPLCWLMIGNGRESADFSSKSPYHGNTN
jgi:hypothetical protein